MRQKFIPAARLHLLTPLFDAVCNIFGLGKKYREQIVAHLNISKRKVKVLDAGCGSGSLAIEVKRKFPNCSLYAVDADSHILKIAMEKTAKAQQQIIFRKAFLQKLPFEDKSFDIVYSSLVFHHLNSNTKIHAMKEIYRVLKPKGRFLLVDFALPKNKLLAFYSWFSVLFEEGYDNFKGRIPKILSETGFNRIEKVGEYRFNVAFIKAVKGGS